MGLLAKLLGREPSGPRNSAKANALMPLCGQAYGLMFMEWNTFAKYSYDQNAPALTCYGDFTLGATLGWARLLRNELSAEEAHRFSTDLMVSASRELMAANESWAREFIPLRRQQLIEHGDAPVNATQMAGMAVFAQIVRGEVDLETLQVFMELLEAARTTGCSENTARAYLRTLKKR